MDSHESRGYGVGVVTGGAQLPATPKKVSEVELQISRLSSAVEVLNKLTSTLETRLEPVLRQAPPSDTGSEKEISPTTGLASTICSKKELIEAVNNRLHSILEMLEL